LEIWNRVIDCGHCHVQEYKLDKIPMWACIQGLPDDLMRKKELFEKVAKKFGDPTFTVIVNEGRINPTKYLHHKSFWISVNLFSVCSFSPKGEEKVSGLI
jgi:hypothetical protein